MLLGSGLFGVSYCFLVCIVCSLKYIINHYTIKEIYMITHREKHTIYGTMSWIAFKYLKILATILCLLTIKFLQQCSVMDFLWAQWIMTNGFITKYLILTATYKWSQTYVCTIIFHTWSNPYLTVLHYFQRIAVIVKN